MSKRKAPPEAGTADSVPFHSPFGELAKLRAQMGPATVEAAPVEQPAPSRPAFAGKIVVRMERKGRGGKTVTVVEGIRSHTAGYDQILREMKSAFGCGGVMEGTDVVLQGELGPRVKQWLEAQGAKKVVLGN